MYYDKIALIFWLYYNTFDGLTYRVHDFGPGGDSNATSVWVLENGPKVAFVGDLVFNGHHPYIADDHILDWLKNLDRARQQLANTTTIYPGHGKPGSIDLIDSQKNTYWLTLKQLRSFLVANQCSQRKQKET